MLRVAGKAQGGVVTERRFPCIWLGMRFHTHEHLVAREVDGGVVRTRTLKEMPEQMTMEKIMNIHGAPAPPPPPHQRRYAWRPDGPGCLRRLVNLRRLSREV